MNDLTMVLAVSVAALTMSLSLPGCGDSAPPPPASPRAAAHGHDHARDGHSGHEGHDHAAGEHEEHDGHDHGEMHPLGTVTIAGTTLAVSVSGDIRPSSEVHLDLEVQSGPVPAAVRFWIGDEAATGSLKAKAESHDNHFHGETEAPADLKDARLWLEIETDKGTRDLGSIALD
jgi:hypothetical protein